MSTHRITSQRSFLDAAVASDIRNKLVREIERTGDEFIAALEVIAKWEIDHPWPDHSNGITEAHYEWRRQKNAVGEACGFSRKAELNMAAYHAAREAGVYPAIRAIEYPATTTRREAEAATSRHAE